MRKTVAKRIHVCAHQIAKSGEFHQLYFRRVLKKMKADFMNVPRKHRAAWLGSLERLSLECKSDKEEADSELMHDEKALGAVV